MHHEEYLDGRVYWQRKMITHALRYSQCVTGTLYGRHGVFSLRELNSLFRLRAMKISKLRNYCKLNPAVTCVVSITICWRHQIETFSAVLAPLCGEFTGHQWIPFTKASDTELWYFLWSTSEQTSLWLFEMPSCSLLRHCNDRPVIGKRLHVTTS